MLHATHLAGFGGSAVAATVVYNSSQAWTGLSSNTLTWSTSLGTPSSDRVVIVGVLNNDSRSSAPSNLTVGGVTATKVGEVTNATGSIVQFWTAPVPSGTTVNVTVKINGTVDSFGLASFSATGLLSATPTSVVSSTRAPGATAITTPDRGFAVSVSMSGAATVAPTATWTNAIEQFDALRPFSQGTTFSGAINSIPGLASITCTWTATTSGGRATLTAAWA